MAEQSLLSSERWLQLHGLKSKKLTLKQILSQIGFPQSEGTVLPDGPPSGRLPQPLRSHGQIPVRVFAGRCDALTQYMHIIEKYNCSYAVLPHFIRVCVYVCVHACVCGVCMCVCMHVCVHA
jgi:hypothetical protein